MFKFSHILKKYVSLILSGIAILLFIISKWMNHENVWIETYYSSTLNKWMIQGLSHVTGLFPFSLGEILFVTHFLALPIVIGILIDKRMTNQSFQFFKQIVSYLSVIFILYLFLWGFNYNRLSISDLMDLEVRNSDTKELYDITYDLIMKANELREEVDEDVHGIMTIEGGYQSIFERAHLGFDVVGRKYPELSGKYGKPKFVTLSKPMLHTGIVGMYFPFTAEANVNVATPILFTPADTLHEMAHQRGFASEDDAEYIAYLTAANHPDVDFQYSGTVSALTSTMYYMLHHDYKRALELEDLYSEGLKRDLDYYNHFWIQYNHKADEYTAVLNDAYFIGYGKKQGVHSYGRVNDLLLAHYRKFGEI